jgi:hypothetical protein
MPFEEIKQLKDFIRVHNDSEITISKSLTAYFIRNDALMRVKVFIDEDNKLVGLMPSEEGYKLSNNGGGYSICCKVLAEKLPTKEFFPKWDKKQHMLVFSYETVTLK